MLPRCMLQRSNVGVLNVTRVNAARSVASQEIRDVQSQLGAAHVVLNNAVHEAVRQSSHAE